MKPCDVTSAQVGSVRPENNSPSAVSWRRADPAGPGKQSVSSGPLFTTPPGESEPAVVIDAPRLTTQITMHRVSCILSRRKKKVYVMVLQVHGCIQITLMDQKSLNMGTFIIVLLLSSFILTKSCSKSSVKEETHLHA